MFQSFEFVAIRQMSERTTTSGADCNSEPLTCAHFISFVSFDLNQLAASLDGSRFQKKIGFFFNWVNLKFRLSDFLVNFLFRIQDF